MTFFLDVKTKDVWRILGLALLALMLLSLLYLAAKALVVLAVAGFIAVAVHRPVTYLAGKFTYGGRKLAAAVVYLLIALLVAIIGYLVIPLIISQGQELVRQLPAYLTTLQADGTLLGNLINQLLSYLEVFALSLIEGIIYSAEATMNFVLQIAGNIVYVIFTIAISFSMAVEGPRLVAGFDKLLPSQILRHVKTLRSRMFKAVSGFVTGQVVITTIAASITFLLLTLLGLPAPLSLAATIWLTGLIPLIGNTLGASLVVLVALSQSPLAAVLLAVYYVVYQQIENNVLEPLIQAKTVHLTPLIVLTSAVIGISLAGFVGALLAIPAGACARIVVEYYLEVRRELSNPA